MLSIERLACVQFSCQEEIKPAALCFAKDVEESTGLQVAPWHDIADRSPMRDGDGEVLLSSVFGWNEHTQWWMRPPRAAVDQVSPIVFACRYEAEPFWVNAEGFRTRLPNPFLSGIPLVQFYERTAMVSAIVVPVHGPFGQIGAVSFSPREMTRTDLSEEFLRYGDILDLYAKRFVYSYLATCLVPALPVETIPLTRREAECLRWASLGKTNDEIAELLSLSTSTIRFHIASAAEKLHAVNRTQAVLKAALRGYIKFRCNDVLYA